MTLVALSIFDIKADYFSPPFFARSRNEGVRTFIEAGRDSQSRLSQYPEDFVLYQVGVFNDNDGRYEPHAEAPARLCSMVEALSNT